ncbi:pyridoxamine 5'-phosphate oxidase family protein [Peptoniphilus stercorisuis]|uniref:Nitroimidazol reductase NimA-like FMN-containing flavoprotein (Pyridoxamine 5'-phosphate oxidase superfamily) n=1 Tax=Peptoniphilus stercorisuis TaxID=1436965 RepID=A0ABS4KC54_9FIRM|nr:pyridoxamine 5'-phosphate oxidase family protein [Peptoniphilus stercorisuis]MBP2025340.1 nitroimidazol reductase NimA-like FMN-containing flavoprotein (pyridoxamine 5'-phosphate oxidase superfamily) [Peptoniphilus stercorisuis]
MQNRMKTHPLKDEEIKELLLKVQTGSIATLNENNIPYVLAVHFVYMDNKIYIHGLPKGEKIDNIKRNSKVGFTAYEVQGFLLDKDEKPCDTNTEYKSVVLNGDAKIIENLELKKSVLKKIVEKYTPHLADKEIPENMIKGTGVIEIEIDEITGKYYN